jgi:hypothetical protein
MKPDKATKPGITPPVFIRVMPSIYNKNKTDLSLPANHSLPFGHQANSAEILNISQ